MAGLNVGKALLPLAVLALLGSLAGCAGIEYAPKQGLVYYHKELPAADRAVESARAAGRAEECPDEFGAVEKMRNQAYEMYSSCNTVGAIALANEAVGKARALCPRKMAAPPPPPPPPAVSISASPGSIKQGQCTSLAWSWANAASASIDQGIGSVDPIGSRSVCPGSTTQYTIAAAGEGGSRTAATTVTVTPVPPAPAVSISASPGSIRQGQCTSLAWSWANAASASIDQGIGSVDPSGSRSVCPENTTQYTIAATGEGGSRTASATVTVTPAPPAPKVIDRLTVHVNFDFDKTDIRPPDVAELQKAIDFVQKYPDRRISLEGHTDSIGTDEYNQGLSERRAAAVKEYLLAHGVTGADRITTKGYGESRPVADNSTAEGRFQNRRTEILILADD